jgi:hypothetical protein
LVIGWSGVVWPWPAKCLLRLEKLVMEASRVAQAGRDADEAATMSYADEAAYGA